MKTLDISRLLEQPAKRYVSVRLSQGRVLLDSDASEQQYLAESERKQTIVDLLGHKGSPDEGFSLGRPVPDLPADYPAQTEGLQPLDMLRQELIELGGELTQVRPVSVRAGTHYLAGMRLILERPEHIALQRDFLQMRATDLPQQPEPTEEEPDPKVPLAALYVLHAWEQTVSSHEDKEVFEVALGEDTTGRVRQMRRVEVFSDLDDEATSCSSAWSRFEKSISAPNTTFDRRTGELKSLARLSLRSVDPQDQENCGGCSTGAADRFLGADHQTLRIQLTAPDRYVWALDNASDLYRVEVTGVDDPDAEEVTIKMLTPPGAVSDWPLTGRVVEVIPFGAILDGEMPASQESPFFNKVADRTGAFVRVARAYNGDDGTFTVERGEGTLQIAEFVTSWDSRHPAARELNFDAPPDTRFFYLRVWHTTEPSEPLDRPLNDQRPLPGTNVVPVFQRAGRKGDYWIISTRPGTRYAYSPFELSEKASGAPPHGPRDFYAPLGLVLPMDRGAASPEKKDEDRVGSVEDCRVPITRLSDRGCVTFSVGDGVRSQGDFSSIQEALDALPSGGGVIQLREGRYRERVLIRGLEHVTIEGCGSEVIWESPLPVLLPSADDTVVLPELDLISIQESKHIQLRGLVIHSVDDVAVHVHQGSHHVDLSGLWLRAGIFVRNSFQPEARAPHVPLLRLEGGHSVNCSRLVAEPHIRPFVIAQGCDQMVFEDLTVAGVAESQTSPTNPQVEVISCELFSFRNSVLSAFGQAGVRLAGEYTSDAEVRDVAVIVGEHRRIGNRAVTPALSGLSVDGARRIRITHCTVTMDESVSEHAGIVVQGEEIFVEGNRIEALARCYDSPAVRSPADCQFFRPAAWGGIHVRGGSESVYVRENRIVGGVGHGVTLGSVVWTRRGGAISHEGAGRGQMLARRDLILAPTGNLRGRLRARDGSLLSASDEGPLRNIYITGNRIEQMSGNGISVISVLGMPGQDDLVEVIGLRIEANTIVDNLRAPFDRDILRTDVLPEAGGLVDAPQEVSLLPAGGIVLGVVQRGDIIGNVIAENGVEERLAICGLFILTGDALRISQNRIVQNGGKAPLDSPRSPPPGLPAGVRAGIAVMLAGTGEVSSVSDLGAVFDDFGAGLPTDGSSLRIMGNSVRQPEGRALHVVATGPVAIQGNAFSSEGNHGPDTFAESYEVGDVVFVMDLGHPWETPIGPYVPPDSSIQRHFLTDRYMDIDSPSNSPRAFLGNGGRLLFNNNQVLLDWEVQRRPRVGRAPIAFFPVALLSLDHVGVDNNQFSFRLRGPHSTEPPWTHSPVFGYPEPVLGQVLTIGATSNISGNRFSEALGQTIFSLCALGHLQSQVTFNQATHEIFLGNQALSMNLPNLMWRIPQVEASADDEWANGRNTHPSLKAHNQVLLSFDGNESPAEIDRLHASVEVFLQLVWRGN